LDCGGLRVGYFGSTPELSGQKTAISNAMTSDVLTPDSPPQTLATLDDMRERIRKISRLKGRQADVSEMREVQALMGPAP